MVILWVCCGYHVVRVRVRLEFCMPMDWEWVALGGVVHLQQQTYPASRKISALRVSLFYCSTLSILIPLSLLVWNHYWQSYRVWISVQWDFQQIGIKSHYGIDDFVNNAYFYKFHRHEAKSRNIYTVYIRRSGIRLWLDSGSAMPQLQNSRDSWVESVSRVSTVSCHFFIDTKQETRESLLLNV